MFDKKIQILKSTLGKTAMEIIVSETIGFCSGVKKAINGAEKALKNDENIYCLGDIIHNSGVVNRLKEKGMVFIKNVEEIPIGTSFIIRSHGLPFDIIDTIKKRVSKIYDFTCPKVKKSHKLVETLKTHKRPIIIVGNKDHPEVKAIYSLTENKGIIIEKPEEVKNKLNSDECYVLVQTTFKPALFYEIVEEIISISKKSIIYNTLCEETTKRQQEVSELAKKVDLIIVVGGKHSSNTKTLYSIAKNIVKSVHIENANELQKDWFTNVQRVGIASGASTPDYEIDRIIEKIHSFENK